jgi:hypothetical protein
MLYALSCNCGDMKYEVHVHVDHKNLAESNPDSCSNKSVRIKHEDRINRATTKTIVQSLSGQMNSVVVRKKERIEQLAVGVAIGPSGRRSS